MGRGGLSILGLHCGKGKFFLDESFFFFFSIAEVKYCDNFSKVIWEKDLITDP